ncbi:MAG: DUF1700 domain-containing protein [Clostridiales bacterium]|jgi:uncharacterized membrane protein|nr:DUF1700 domain-containing protein [Clostridiales bacterium]
MKKSEFEARLLEGLETLSLDTLSDAEKEKIIDYYTELYLDKAETGMSEDEIVAEWGSPRDAAIKVLSDGADDDREEAKQTAKADKKRFKAKSGEAKRLAKKAAKEAKADKKRFKAESGEAKRLAKKAAKEAKADKKRFKAESREAKRRGGATKEDASKTRNEAKDSADGGGSANKNIKINQKQGGKKMFRNKTFWTVYFSGFIITFPLTAALFGAAVGIASAAIAVVVAFLAVAVSFILGGAALTVFGVYYAFISFNDGVLAVGSGIVLFGLGLLFYAIVSLPAKALRAGKNKKTNA